MDKKEMLQKVSESACRFIYSNYEFDEIANGKDMVMYCIGDRLLLSVYIREDSFDFLLILSEEDRKRFEAERGNFPQAILDIYENAKAKNDGKWLWIPVADMETLEGAKKLILLKEKPNRTPFPKDTAIYSKCGARCDMCVYYLNGVNGKDSPGQVTIHRQLTRFWGEEDWTWSCAGCFAKNSDECGMGKLECPKSKGYAHCLECRSYPCSDCGTISLRLQAETSRTADTTTWAILPYVGGLDEKWDK